MKNILVINGSPKGENSITLQTSLYLQKKFCEYNFSVLHAGKKISLLEKDFSSAKKLLTTADLIIFSYPVYTFLAPSQLHRFISLLKEKSESGEISLTGKFATQITTSKHFYDITAHEYVKENCEDLGLTYLEGLSCDMEDLTKITGQKEAVSFLRKTLFLMGENVSHEEKIKDETLAKKIKVSVVADFSEGNEDLKEQVEYFISRFPYETEVIDISKIGMKGGCLGCFNCASSGECIYKDGYEEILREHIIPCDAHLYAFKIKNHSMGDTFKMFDDRQFCNGHRTLSRGKPVSYIVDGNMENEQNVKTLLEARSQVGGQFLTGIAWGESFTETEKAEWKKRIDRMTSLLVYALENKYSQSSNFYGVGGMKIFRDLIYLMGGMMKADYAFFKKEGLFDFPQKQKGTRSLMRLVGLMMKPRVMKKLGNRMTEGMLMPYRKVLDKS